MADIPLAQAHPSEILAALTATGVGLISLIGLIYTRMNKDIDGLSEEITEVKDDFDDACERHKAEENIRLDAIYTKIDNHKTHDEQKHTDLAKDIANIGNDLTRIGAQIAQFSMSSTFTNEALSKLELEIKDLNKRLQTIEVEHKHCIRLHQNLLGGTNEHH